MKEWCAGVAMVLAFVGCGDSDCESSDDLFDYEGIECPDNMFSLTRHCIANAIANDVSFWALSSAGGDAGRFLIKNKQNYYAVDFVDGDRFFVTTCSGLVDTAVSDTCDDSPDRDQWCFHCENPVRHATCD